MFDLLECKWRTGPFSVFFVLFFSSVFYNTDSRLIINYKRL